MPTVYQTTVDREHLHFVATHLVGRAVESLTQSSADGKLAGGSPTVLIDITIDVASVLDRKRAAMAAHISQIPPDSEAMLLDDATFAAVYGHEWYVRSGPPTVLDQLNTS